MIQKFVDIVSIENGGNQDITIDGEPYHIIAITDKKPWTMIRYVPSSILKTDDYYQFYAFCESDGWCGLPVMDNEFVENFICGRKEDV